MSCVNDLMQALFDGGLLIDEVHSWRSHHDLPSGEVSHAKYAFEHEPAFCANDLVVFRV